VHIDMDAGSESESDYSDLEEDAAPQKEVTTKAQQAELDSIAADVKKKVQTAQVSRDHMQLAQ